jgi:hypothetical protein
MEKAPSKAFVGYINPSKAFLFLPLQQNRQEELFSKERRGFSFMSQNSMD